MRHIQSFDCYEATFHFEPPVPVPSDMLIDSLGAIEVGSRAHDHSKPEVAAGERLNADVYHKELIAHVNVCYHHDLDPLPLIADVLHEDLRHKHAVTFVDHRRTG